MERKKIRLNRLRNHCRTLSEFKGQAQNIVNTINIQLAGGWSPFGESENVRYYTPIDDVMAAYIDEKSKELKQDSLRSYKSFCNIFGRWCSSHIPGCKCIQFNRTLAVRYMDYIYSERNVSARAYNNQLKMARALFSWAVQKCYCKENPFELIKIKKEQEKKRILIPADVRGRIKAYFEEHSPNYIIVMELVFTSLLRPKEISRVQIKQINLKEQHIYMPSDKTKNGHHRYAFLSEELCRRIAGIIGKARPEDYLFSHGYMPGIDYVESKRYRKDWDKMRKALKLPQEMQLYSLRDTGINNMLKSGIDPLTVMQAADHHDLSMTTRYANHADPNLISTLNVKAPQF
ncbi:MAG: site-specific integrase [Paludibacter sp.]|nr:site-specific integrase [Bacteroidales bacterium]MCM1068936.1 site-specific integrase [Prevotella sp.]MCM1353197.1 site-specific integrase [Bacteroides sp.]MCM1481362.1 site-specific integrase [Paludibacter sp.]MCM1402628.1 site-specific integrase [Bacteroides sp.]